MKTLDKIDRPIALFCKTIIFVAFIIIIVSASIQVFYRFVLDKSFSWTDELCRYGMIWITFVGAGYAVRTHQHIAVDLLKNYVPAKFGAVLDQINSVLTFLLGIILTYFGGKLSLMNMTQLSPGLKLSMGFMYGSIPLCGILICIYAAFDVVGWVAPEKREKKEV